MATTTAKPTPKPNKHYNVQVNLLVEANSEEDAQTYALAAMGYARRLLDCPLGAKITGSKELTNGHKQWVQENKTTPFDLVTSKATNKNNTITRKPLTESKRVQGNV